MTSRKASLFSWRLPILNPPSPALPLFQPASRGGEGIESICAQPLAENEKSRHPLAWFMHSRAPFHPANAALSSEPITPARYDAGGLGITPSHWLPETDITSTQGMHSPTFSLSRRQRFQKKVAVQRLSQWLSMLMYARRQGCIHMPGLPQARLCGLDLALQLKNRVG